MCVETPTTKKEAIGWPGITIDSWVVEMAGESERERIHREILSGKREWGFEWGTAT